MARLSAGIGNPRCYINQPARASSRLVQAGTYRERVQTGTYRESALLNRTWTVTVMLKSLLRLHWKRSKLTSNLVQSSG